MKKNKTLIILFLFITFFLIYKIGEIPTGLFCDEAKIGNLSYQLTKGNVSFIPPFFYQHFNYILGYLPIIATVPFVLLGQLSELTVRLSSVFYSLLSLLIIYLTLKELKAKIIVPLLLLAFSPLFFHISRINFGHAPSFFLISLGFYFYLKFKKEKRLPHLIMAAAALGIGSYGHGSFMIAAPLFLVSLVVAEMLTHKLNFRQYRAIILLTLGFLIFYSPILFQLNSNPRFSQRLRDKNDGKTIQIKQKISELLKNYPKYFSPEYLFTKGEIDLPGAFISRHSIRGNGIYLKIYLPMIVIAFFNLLFMKDKQKNYFLPLFIFFSLSPLPDLLTTKTNAPPYSFSLFHGLITIPFITAYALKIFDYLPKKFLPIKTYKTLGIIFICVLLLEIFSFLRNYYQSPLYSSDYWGWQYGPKEIIKYFISQKDNYDEFYMTGYFNEPLTLLSFYNYDQKCRHCFIGGPKERLNNNKRQLFAIRVEEISHIKLEDYFLKKVIRLPNNQEAYYLIEPKKNS